MIKMKKYYKYISLIIIVSLFIPFFSVPKTKAYTSSLGNVINVNVTADKAVLTIDNGAELNDDILEIKVLKTDLLEVNYRPNGISKSPDTPMLDSSKQWSQVGANIQNLSDKLVITTSDINVELTKSPARMTVKKSDGTTLLWEPSSGGVFYDGIKFQHDPSHNIYGIRSFDAFDNGGDLLRNNSNHPAHAGQQGDSGGPFLWSTSGYGVLIDSDGGYPLTESATGKLEFYYGGTPVEGRRYTKQNVKYYLMIGEPEKIMKSFSDVTGKSPLLPKWGLGFSNFEWDTNESEMTNMVDTYRAKNIPIDSYGLDYDWKKYGENNYGEFTWNTTKFPSASTTSFKDTMNNKGIKMIGITKPRIVTKDASNTRTQQYYDAEAGGYWYPGHNEYQDYFIPVTVRSIDPYNSGARTWLWDKSKPAFDKGIVGWWNDETDKVSSNGAEYWFGNFTTTHLSQSMYEGQRSYTNGAKRVWQTARTYYPGAQRYATTLWSGDIGIQFQKGEKVTWAAGMKEQKAVMLSSINNGQPKWGMDIGGFNQNSGTTSNPNPELYTRWMQFGAFTPVFRVHGNNYHQRQPWFYGKTAEEITKGYIHLRYKLFPYMYSSERETYDTGVGLVRPLMWEYPSDPNAANNTDSWMFGDSLLVSPIVEKGQKSKNIYLPAGKWIDYFRGVEYTGSQTINYDLNDDSWTDLPLFIKKGAIIPTQEVLEYTEQKNITDIDIDAFPDTQSSSFVYYDDDGNSYNYENGQYFSQRMTLIDQGVNGIKFNVLNKEGSYVSPLSYYLIKIHGKAGNSVTSNGTSLIKFNDLNALKGLQGEGYAAGKDIYGDVTYVKIKAGLVKEIIVSGSNTSTSTDVVYEAEEASLSGATTSTKAKKNNYHSGYTGIGYVDNFDKAGAAVTFYANVKTGGDYKSKIRYSNATGKEQNVSVYVNGKYVKQIALPSLSSWSSWSDSINILPLEAGFNAVTYKYDEKAGDTGNVNLDHLSIPFTPEVLKFEAENAKLTSAGINTDHFFYSGSAFVDNLTKVGSEVQFNVNVPAQGNYNVSLKYANGTMSTKTISTYVNGGKVRQISLDSPGGNWNIWRENTQVLTLNAGVNKISFKYDQGDSGNVNLDRLLLSQQAITPPISEINLLDNPGFERSENLSNWTEWHPTGQTVAFGVDSGSGINPPESPFEGDRRAYFYLSSAYKQSIHQKIDVANNATYKVEAWVKLKNTSPNVARLEVTQYGGSDKFLNIQNTGEWQRIVIDNVQVTNGQIDIGVYVDSPGGTTLHIDDVSVTKK
jgi:alpha-glucosidase (family GH31 glycosyl hydrolase)